ncbi:MAG: class I SAM-dependent methyltransferase, partial [Planctomycetes bacterium]|nr:class I SAM-dependent methyltransferase [Planctomycetota bacterium]
MTTGGDDPDLATTRGVARAAAVLYAGSPLGARTLARLRPRICPFEAVIALVPPGAHMLDIGCGNGLLLGLLASCGRLAHATGIDFSGRTISAARLMREGLPPAQANRLSFRRQNAHEPWPSGPFDVVALIDVLHHVEPGLQRPLIERACAAVAPGGMLLYKDMVARPRWRAGANRLHDLVLARQWIHHRALDEVAPWAEASGLACERRARVNRWW